MREKKNNLYRENGQVITPYRVFNEEAYEHFLKYKQNYDKKRYRRYSFRLVNQNDGDLIDFLESHDQVSNYIKNLVIADMKKEVKAKRYVPLSQRQPEEGAEQAVASGEGEKSE